MNELQQKIVNAVDAAGGKATWPQIMDALEYPERQRGLENVRALEKMDVLLRVLQRNPDTGKMELTISKVGA